MLSNAQFGFQMKSRTIGVRVSLIEETRYQWDSHSNKHNANSWTDAQNISHCKQNFIVKKMLMGYEDQCMKL